MKQKKDIDNAIAYLVDPDKLKQAWNNKGVILMRMKKWKDAVLCFDSALEIDSSLEEAKRNKEKCIKQLLSSKLNIEDTS